MAGDNQDWLDAKELLATLGISRGQGTIGVGPAGWVVIIYEQRKRPPLIAWKGRPVTYRIGGGHPMACAA